MYLGHVSQNEVEMDSDKIVALTSLPVLICRNWGHFWSLQDTISNLCRNTWPLLVHCTTSLYTNHTSKIIWNRRWNQYPTITQKSPLVRIGLQQVNFDHITGKLTSAPALGFGDPHKPYVLHTIPVALALGKFFIKNMKGRIVFLHMLAEAYQRVNWITLHTNCSS